MALFGRIALTILGAALDGCHPRPSADALPSKGTRAKSLLGTIGLAGRNGDGIVEMEDARGMPDTIAGRH
jgi:hypothetical protein